MDPIIERVLNSIFNINHRPIKKSYRGNPVCVGKKVPIDTWLSLARMIQVNLPKTFSHFNAHENS